MATEPSSSDRPSIGSNPDDPDFHYDEFGYFDENCDEYGLTRPENLAVERLSFIDDAGRVVSALKWGASQPQLVFLHGGAQNAHTWDTVAIALNRPLLAFDLPGHGHSDARTDGWYDPHHNADAVISAWDQAGIDQPVMLVGMSLGGLTATAVAARRPDLISSLVIVDITPGVTSDKAKAIHDFVAGPQHFETFGEIFDRTVEFNPTRSATSLRRGILHNAHRVTEGENTGSWEWNYDRRSMAGEVPEFKDLWADVGAVEAPYTLVRGALSPVVDEDDIAELRRRQPEVSVVVAPQSGHSVQGDEPLLLAEILAGLAST